ncbi:Hcp family type VI secretion system effector [Granulosicoccus antarcticus]|uniref:Major exported protein n=1 Tax=Granulosicoccus antarcticus IMCC3135 TaxID=1192854 RepID=A0A2Z2NRX3_9GAMM|nr:type VI secretion system tube protein Hcp [Granulosicoccus antarcticus]ASJ73255.1 hypothetical protein IMCC3135_15865 [Granulosicoccus antarcticus IMCC3135]
MAETIFVEIPEVTGDADDDKHKGWIVVHSMSFSVERMIDMNDLSSNQRSHANTRFNQIELVSSLGTASNNLMSAVVSGKSYREIKLHVCRPSKHSGNVLEAYSNWTLKDAIIDRYELQVDNGGTPEEAWAIAYSKIEHEYKSIDKKNGNLEKVNTFKWNLSTGKAE